MVELAERRVNSQQLKDSASEFFDYQSKKTLFKKSPSRLNQ